MKPRQNLTQNDLNADQAEDQFIDMLESYLLSRNQTTAVMENNFVTLIDTETLQKQLKSDLLSKDPKRINPWLSKQIEKLNPFYWYISLRKDDISLFESDITDVAQCGVQEIIDSIPKEYLNLIGHAGQNPQLSSSNSLTHKHIIDNLQESENKKFKAAASIEEDNELLSIQTQNEIIKLLNNPLPQWRYLKDFSFTSLKKSGLLNHICIHPNFVVFLDMLDDNKRLSFIRFIINDNNNLETILAEKERTQNLNWLQWYFCNCSDEEKIKLIYYVCLRNYYKVPKYFNLLMENIFVNENHPLVWSLIHKFDCSPELSARLDRLINLTAVENTFKLIVLITAFLFNKEIKNIIIAIHQKNPRNASSLINDFLETVDILEKNPLMIDSYLSPNIIHAPPTNHLYPDNGAENYLLSESNSSTEARSIGTNLFTYFAPIENLNPIHTPPSTEILRERQQTRIQGENANPNANTISSIVNTTSSSGIDISTLDLSHYDAILQNTSINPLETWDNLKNFPLEFLKENKLFNSICSHPYISTFLEKLDNIKRLAFINFIIKKEKYYDILSQKNANQDETWTQWYFYNCSDEEKIKLFYQDCYYGSSFTINKKLFNSIIINLPVDANHPLVWCLTNKLDIAPMLKARVNRIIDSNGIDNNLKLNVLLEAYKLNNKIKELIEEIHLKNPKNAATLIKSFFAGLKLVSNAFTRRGPSVS